MYHSRLGIPSELGILNIGIPRELGRKWKIRDLPFGEVGVCGLLLHPSELFTFKRIT